MSDSISYKKQAVGFAIWGLIWSALHTAAIHRLGFDFKIALVDSLVNNTFLVLACLFVSNSMRWISLDKKSRFIVMPTIFLLTLLCAKLSVGLLAHIFNENTLYVDAIQKTLLIRFGIAFLVITWVTLALRISKQFAEKQEAEKHKTDSEKLLRDAELIELRQQLQPHFLFNSLNSISALAGSKPEEARKMIQQLSDFLRGTLKKDDNQFTSLQEELKHLQLYLEIEKVRFGHRLHIDFNTDETSLPLVIPPLLLQPIVENAIKFGLYDTIGDVCIKIISKKENNNLHITISNPFDKETAQPNRGTGFGLKSVQRRLYLLFYRNDLVQTNTTENTFTTTITIPQL